MVKRDYRPKTRRPARKARTGISGWVWYLAGLGSGVAISVAVYLQPWPTDALPESVRRIAEGKPRGSDSEPRRPRFEFYTMLPEMEVAVPEEELRPPPSRPAAKPSKRAPVQAPAAKAPSPPEGGASYVLQVGSFRGRDDAERLKASLALLGLEARIQTVAINGKSTWHRVRIGPYRDVNRLNEARGRLRENQLESMILKIRG